MSDNSNIWINIMEKYKNSVLQLICVYAVFNPYRPQLIPSDAGGSGTGFIVDISKGLVLTNAHVVYDAISISGRMTKFGEQDLSLRLISICREKDVALCQLSKQDTEKILAETSPDNVNMVFGDNILVRETDPVVTIGYPLGQKYIKLTTGVVSGFHDNNDKADNYDIGTEEESPTYIQITAPINPGNSGGPLLNRKGEVIGINASGFMFSQNIGYSIGSRTVLSIYDELIRPLSDVKIKIPHIVVTPKYSFEYNRVSQALLELSCNQNGGVYVKRVYKNSIFDTLEEGDIITSIWYDDIYINNPDAFNVINRKKITGTQVVGTFDKYGDIIVNLMCENNHIQCRKWTIKEIFDMIPFHTKISITICRNKSNYRISTIFEYVPSSIRMYIYPRIDKFKYLIVAGMSIGELTMNHVSRGDELESYGKGKKRFEPYLVINQIFPDTTSYHTKVFARNSILEEVNGVKVNTIDDLKTILSKSGEYLTFVGKDREKLVIKKSETIREDTMAAEQFGITDYKSPLA